MLYLVSVPIGNLGDITLRAIETLEKVDMLLCEDTRLTTKLLGLLKIVNHPQLISFYDEVEESKISLVTEWIKQGKEVALVSDAGTPLLSDPGWKLVRRCRDAGFPYTAVPGACAAINGLVLSGLSPARFSFLGFLPKKRGERIRLLENYKNIGGSKVVYESPFRVRRLVDEIKEVFGGGVEIRVVEEMTKMHEKVLDASQVKEKSKGEATVIFY